MNTNSQLSIREACFACVRLAFNHNNVQNVLHVQVSLAAVNQTCVIHEAMNVCKKLKIH